jgi:hypothetical protein
VAGAIVSACLVIQAIGLWLEAKAAVTLWHIATTSSNREIYGQLVDTVNMLGGEFLSPECRWGMVRAKTTCTCVEHDVFSTPECPQLAALPAPSSNQQLTWNLVTHAPIRSWSDQSLPPTGMVSPLSWDPSRLRLRGRAGESRRMKSGGSSTRPRM